MGRLPVFKEQLPEAVIRLTEGEMSREGEYFNRLLGFRQTIQRNPVEQEIVKLNLNPFELYGTSSGDKQYDRDFIKNANELVLRQATARIKSPDYAVLPDAEKALALTNSIREAISVAKETTNETYKANDLLKVYKMKYNKLPKAVKTAIDRRYIEDSGGSSIEEDKAYFQIDKYEAELNARTGGFKGTAADQTRRMLGR
jgi:hypothetical protein